MTATYSVEAPELKECRVCKEILPFDAFEILNKKGKIYFRNECRSCRNRGKEKNISKTPQNFISYLYTGIKNKRKKTHTITITRQELIDKYEEQSGRCAMTGVQLTHIKDGTGMHDTNISVDRIDNDEGYTKDNVWLVCHVVNMMKNTMHLEDLLLWCELIYKNRKSYEKE